MKINFIIDMPFRNPEKHINIELLKARKDITFQTKEFSIKEQINSKSSETFSHLKNECEQLEQNIKDQMKQNQKILSSLQTEGKSNLETLGSLVSIEQEDKTVTKKKCEDLNTYINFLLTTIKNLSNHFENIMLKSNVSNKRLKNILENGVSEIDALSGIAKKLNDERENLIIGFETKLREFKTKSEEENIALSYKYNEILNKSRMSEQTSISKSVELQRINLLLENANEEMKRVQDLNGNTQRKFEEMNKYILELFKSKKEISEELEKFKVQNSEIKQPENGKNDVSEYEFLGNKIWEKIVNTKVKQGEFEEELERGLFLGCLELSKFSELRGFVLQKLSDILQEEDLLEEYKIEKNTLKGKFVLNSLLIKSLFTVGKIFMDEFKSLREHLAEYERYEE